VKWSRLIWLGAVIALSACSSSTSTSAPRATESSTTTAPGASPAATLRTAALAWAHAFLTGTVMEQQSYLQGPCLTGEKPTQSKIAAATARLNQERDRIQRTLGISTATIQSKIDGVSTRNVTAKTGEAEVRYDLPVAATGNDNWVTYELVGGKWKVQNCRSPLGGSSSSASTPPTTTP
jgi:hypothetical protein